MWLLLLAVPRVLVHAAAAAPCVAASDGLHDFQFCAEVLSWSDAAVACAATGAHLVDVEDAAENTWLWAQAEAIEPLVPWWMGLNDVGIEGVYAWDGGATSPYTSWRAGEPNDFGGNEDCARWVAGGGGVWADADCALTQPYVCESGCLYESAWIDTDGDGYGDDGSLTRGCGIPAGWIGVGGDCDDAAPLVHPGESEVCGGAEGSGDEDCDGLVDDADPDWDTATAITIWVDADGDGVGEGGTTLACTVLPGYSAIDGDCNDRDPETYPGAPDTTGDGIDQDCDGADDCLATTDGVHDFTFCGDARSWSDAAAACAGIGAHLVDVEDVAENDWLWAQVQAISPTVPWWLGYSDTAVEGTFTWDGGATSPYTAWRAGEPNDYDANEDCARWIVGGGGAWADADCTLAQPFVCESGCIFEDAYLDADGDGYGDDATRTRGCGIPADRVGTGGDCADTSAVVHPGATEVCGEPEGYADEDCDGLIDVLDTDWDASTGLPFWPDGDGDGVGVGEPTLGCVAPPGYGGADGDCDDADASIYPGAVDPTGDGIDQDCDGQDDCQYAVDADGDGFGDPALPLADCAGGPGIADNLLDCDDADPARNPDAAEVWYDGIDQDCDGADDYDQDGDGVDDPLGGGLDCDDRLAVTFPGAFELCDGHDNDCDGAIDDPNPDKDGEPIPACEECVLRARGDHTYLICPVTVDWPTAAQDCLDRGYHLADALDPGENAWLYQEVHGWYPLVGAWLGLSDRAGEGTFVWESGAALEWTGWKAGEPNAYTDAEDCVRYADDAVGAWNDADCAQLRPYVCELGCAVTLTYPDADGDGFGDRTAVIQECVPSADRVLTGGDCADADPAVSPAAVEVCDDAERDEDCDDLADDADPDTDPATMTTWYLDADGDGYGYDPSFVSACRPPAGYTDVGGDCSDTNAAIFPGAAEALNGIDDDCNGIPEGGDSDGDGLSDLVEIALGCDPALVDSDGDGIGDLDEVNVAAGKVTDADGDGVPDCLDPDPLTGCGCATGGGDAAWMGLSGLVGLVLRRGRSRGLPPRRR